MRVAAASIRTRASTLDFRTPRDCPNHRARTGRHGRHTSREHQRENPLRAEDLRRDADQGPQGSVEHGRGDRERPRTEVAIDATDPNRRRPAVPHCALLGTGTAARDRPSDGTHRGRCLGERQQAGQELRDTDHPRDRCAAAARILPAPPRQRRRRAARHRRDAPSLGVRCERIWKRERRASLRSRRLRLVRIGADVEQPAPDRRRVARRGWRRADRRRHSL